VKKIARMTAADAPGDEREEYDDTEDLEETKSENTDPQVTEKEGGRENGMVGMDYQENDDENIYGRYAVTGGMSDELWEFLEENGRKT
jgi:hypothetical protein